MLTHSRTLTAYSLMALLGTVFGLAIRLLSTLPFSTGNNVALAF